jgi:hypothetical protein
MMLEACPLASSAVLEEILLSRIGVLVDVESLEIGKRCLPDVSPRMAAFDGR